MGQGRIISEVDTHFDIARPDARDQLALFAGGTGGIDSWLTGDHADTVMARLDRLPGDPIIRSQLNQLLALSHRPEVSEGFFKYYWLSEPRHPYDVTRIPQYHDTYKTVDQILSSASYIGGCIGYTLTACCCMGAFGMVTGRFDP
jgi:hypothetical protein